MKGDNGDKKEASGGKKRGKLTTKQRKQGNKKKEGRKGLKQYYTLLWDKEKIKGKSKVVETLGDTMRSSTD